MVVDLLIVGAGPAGCVLASEARARGLSTLLCEAQSDDAQGPHLGETFSFPRPEAGGSRKVAAESFVHWAAPGIGVTTDDTVHLDKQAFNRRLRDNAVHAGARYLPETKIRRVERVQGRWQIHSTKGTIQCNRLADATGRVAAIGRRLGSRRIAFDRLTATTVTLATIGRPTQRLVEATESGWWFCTKHPKLGTVGTYFTDNDLRVDFMDALQKARFASAFLGVFSADRPRVLAASTALLWPFAGPGWFAVGDAAWSCDPLSASGIQNAFVMAAWALDPAEAYQERLIHAFSAYGDSYQSVYRSANRTSLFWQRRAAVRWTLPGTATLTAP